MPRMARLFVPGCAHHIIQRGHNKQTIFLDDQDRQRFLVWVREAAIEHDIALHAWVLMSNHVHFALTAPNAESLAKFGKFFSQRYSQYFNHRYDRMGTLWQGRFKSSVIVSEHYLLRVYRYIELNPVRAGLVAHPENYFWSSCRHHFGLAADALITDHPLYWSLGNTPYDRQANYKHFCAESVLTAENVEITRNTDAGWGLQLEHESGSIKDANRQLKPGARGRPSKIK
jgi:putative transposase